MLGGRLRTQSMMYVLLPFEQLDSCHGMQDGLTSNTKD